MADSSKSEHYDPYRMVSTDSSPLASPAHRALEQPQRPTPGPNAFAQADRARVQHHLSGNAFAAQAHANRAQELAANHPAYRTVTPAEATSSPSVSTPTAASERGESALARSQTPSHDSIQAQRTKPVRRFLDRLTGRSSGARSAEQSPAGPSGSAQALAEPATPLASLAGSTGGGPTPPAKDTPPAGADSPLSTAGSLQIVFPSGLGLGARRDNSSGGLLPIWRGSSSEDMLAAQPENCEGSDSSSGMTGCLLPAVAYQPSPRSSATATVDEHIDSTISTMIADMVKAELSKMTTSSKIMLKRSIEQHDILKADTVDNHEEESKIGTEHDASSTESATAEEAETWAGNLLDDLSRDELRAVIVDQFRQLFGLLTALSDRISTLETPPPSDVNSLADRVAKLEATADSGGQAQITSLARNLARAGMEMAKISQEFDGYRTSLTTIYKGVEELDKRIIKIDSCHLSIAHMHSQLKALSLLVPDDWVLDDSVREANDKLRAQLLARAGGHPQISASLQNSLPGVTGYLAWQLDMLAALGSSYLKIDKTLKEARRYRRTVRNMASGLTAARPGKRPVTHKTAAAAGKVEGSTTHVTAETADKAPAHGREKKP